MAGQRLTDKSGLAQQTAGDDILMVVDVSDTTGSAQGTSKKIEAKNIISVASVSLSSAQIQALHTSAVVLLPAPGSGFMYMVHSVLIDNTYVSTTQTVRRAAQLAFGVPASFVNEIFRVDSWMWNKTANETRRAVPGFLQNTNADNVGVSLTADGAITGNFTAVVHLAYTIIKI